MMQCFNCSPDGVQFAMLDNKYILLQVLSKGTDKASYEIQDYIKRINRNTEELASDEIQDHIKKIDCNPEELQKLFTENLVMDSSFVAAVKLPLNVPYREYSPYEAVPMLW